MDEVLQKATDLWHQFANSPTEQTHALLAGILTVMIFKWRRKRTSVTITASQGEHVSVTVGHKKDAEIKVPQVKISPDGFVKVDRT